jgi:hypothetical protein
MNNIYKKEGNITIFAKQLCKIGRKEEKGKEIYFIGDIYEGDFIDCLAEGTGKYLY